VTEGRDAAPGVALVEAKASLILHEKPDGQRTEGEDGVEDAGQEGREVGGGGIVFF